jgi:uncharacterized peroxidase-related enzyme
MALIPLVEPSQSELVTELESKGKRENRFFRMMAHKPEVLKSFVPFYSAVVGPGATDRRTKELVYLTVSMANECAYCTAAHKASAKKAGISDEEIRALETEQLQNFSEPEREAIRYARELTESATAPTAGEGLFQHFNDEQIVEITLVIAMANFTNRFNNGLGLEPEQ